MARIGPSGFSNPWQQISAGEQGVADAQRRSTEGILGKSKESPSNTRDDKSKYSALIGQGRNWESYVVQQQEEDKKANKPGDEFKAAR